jgi:hypothetical protein
MPCYLGENVWKLVFNFFIADQNMITKFKVLFLTSRWFNKTLNFHTQEVLIIIITLYILKNVLIETLVCHKSE